VIAGIGKRDPCLYNPNDPTCRPGEPAAAQRFDGGRS